MAAGTRSKEDIEKGLLNTDSRVQEVMNCHHQLLKTVEDFGDKIVHLQSIAKMMMSEFQRAVKVPVEKQSTHFPEFKESLLNNYSENVDGGDGYEDWMLSVKATLGMLEKRPWDLSIYKVPNKLRRLKEDAYTPHLVSIGPFHASNHELVAMEEHKWRYMLHFIRRAAPPGTNFEAAEASDQGNKVHKEALEKCGRAISKLGEVARACYAENINLDKYKLVEILLLDGCFILELFIKHADQNQNQDEEKEELDPIIDNLWMIPTLQHDLALLENQIPFVVLKTLFDTIKTYKQFRLSIEEYVLKFFRSALNLSDEAIKDERTTNILHIAHLLHLVVYRPPKKKEKNPNPNDKIEWGFERSVTQLVKSGIQFQPGKVDKDCRLLNITFDEGVIKIPQLDMQEIIDSVFRNLIAFEQCKAGCSGHMASYAWLMKTLIRSPQDAELLKQKGIITNKVGGDKEVSTFFQSLCREVVVKDFCFSPLCEMVNKYNESWLHWGRIKAAIKVHWNEFTDTLHNVYFKSTWTIISFLAALALLCLTILGTSYTVLSYYPH